MADHYQTLGVPKNATQADIKKAYRKLARQYHPDRNPGDESAEDRFKGISVAYETLSDPEKRKHYDLVGDARPGAGAGGFRFDTDSFRSGGRASTSTTSSARSGAGGAAASGPRRAPGSGGQPRLRPADRGDALLRRRAARRAAHDPGREAGHVLHLQRQRRAARHLPDDLSGVPRPRHQEPQPGPVLAAGAVRPLRRRRHRDRVPARPATAQGRIRQTKRYHVKVPPGVKDGGKIRLKGKGEAGVQGGEPGDLYVVAHVTPSPVFTRRGDDLIVDVPVLFVEAAVGATIEVPTAEGETVKLKVPGGTGDGVMLRVKGRGAPIGGSAERRGDLLARVKIVVPKKLSRAQRDASRSSRCSTARTRGPRSSSLAETA